MDALSVLAEHRDMGEIIPLIEIWLTEHEYSVMVLANRIDATRHATKIRLFFHNYAAGCLIKVYAPPEFFDELKLFLAQHGLLHVTIPCTYCQRPVQVTQTVCPHCTAPVQLQ